MAIKNFGKDMNALPDVDDMSAITPDEAARVYADAGLPQSQNAARLYQVRENWPEYKDRDLELWRSYFSKAVKRKKYEDDIDNTALALLAKASRSEYFDDLEIWVGQNARVVMGRIGEHWFPIVMWGPHEVTLEELRKANRKVRRRAKAHDWLYASSSAVPWFYALLIAAGTVAWPVWYWAGHNGWAWLGLPLMLSAAFVVGGMVNERLQKVLNDTLIGLIVVNAVVGLLGGLAVGLHHMDTTTTQSILVCSKSHGLLSSDYEVGPNGDTLYSVDKGVYGGLTYQSDQQVYDKFFQVGGSYRVQIQADHIQSGDRLPDGAAGKCAQ